MDDDIAVNIYALLDILNMYDLQGSIAGYVLKGMKPDRGTSKWKVSYEEWPDEYYPTFVSGWLYAMSPVSARKLVSTLENSKVFWIDDVLVTGVAREKAGVGLVDISPHFALHAERIHCCLQSFECDFVIAPSYGDWELLEHYLKYVAKTSGRLQMQNTGHWRTPLNDTYPSIRLKRILNPLGELRPSCWCRVVVTMVTSTEVLTSESRPPYSIVSPQHSAAIFAWRRETAVAAATDCRFALVAVGPYVSAPHAAVCCAFSVSSPCCGVHVICWGEIILSVAKASSNKHVDNKQKIYKLKKDWYEVNMKEVMEIGNNRQFRLNGEDTYKSAARSEFCDLRCSASQQQQQQALVMCRICRTIIACPCLRGGVTHMKSRVGKIRKEEVDRKVSAGETYRPRSRGLCCHTSVRHRRQPGASSEPLTSTTVQSEAWSLMEGIGPPSPPASPITPPSTPAMNQKSAGRQHYQQYVAQLRSFSEQLAHAPWRPRRAPVTAWPSRSTTTAPETETSGGDKNKSRFKAYEEPHVTETSNIEDVKNAEEACCSRVMSSTTVDTTTSRYRTEIVTFVSRYSIPAREDDVETPRVQERFMKRLESADEGCCDTLALPGGPSPAGSSLGSARSSSPCAESEDEEEEAPAWRQQPEWRTQRCASSDSAVVLDFRSTPSWQEDDDDELELEEGAARAWRTPSVVVSDFSDETPPIWLDLGGPDADEDAERCRRLSDCSSCSGGGLCAPQRKVSDCSTCSTLSGDEDGLASRLAELSPFRAAAQAKKQTLKSLCIVRTTCSIRRSSSHERTCVIAKVNASSAMLVHCMMVGEKNHSVLDAQHQLSWTET
ncbi:hypothetical protein B566_EDAN010701 [Ephemera danica]|nr:hypothetical protein B566_EDAN010701 [Ephemera danica]